MTRERTVADLYDDEIFEVLVAMLDIASRLAAHAAVRRPPEALRMGEIGERCDELHTLIIAHWAAQATAAPPLDDELDLVDEPASKKRTT
jgi:hypothetical protein